MIQISNRSRILEHFVLIIGILFTVPVVIYTIFIWLLTLVSED